MVLQCGCRYPRAFLEILYDNSMYAVCSIRISKMKTELRQKAIDMRVDDEASYSEIRKKLGVAKSTLSYWLREHPLSSKRISELRKSGWEKGEASREKYRNTMREKKEKIRARVYQTEKEKFQNLSQETLYVAGLMLYSAEGGKKDAHRITLANTDVAIILFFIKWVQMFFDIETRQLRFQLHLYENMNIRKEEKFWRDSFSGNIKKSQFYKTQIRPLKAGSFTYKGSNNHGTCSIFVSSTEKKVKLIQSIRAFFDLHKI